MELEESLGGEGCRQEASRGRAARASLPGAKGADGIAAEGPPGRSRALPLVFPAFPGCVSVHPWSFSSFSPATQAFQGHSSLPRWNVDGEQRSGKFRSAKSTPLSPQLTPCPSSSDHHFLPCPRPSLSRPPPAFPFLCSSDHQLTSYIFTDVSALPLSYRNTHHPPGAAWGQGLFVVCFTSCRRNPSVRSRACPEHNVSTFWLKACVADISEYSVPAGPHPTVCLIRGLLHSG